VPQKKESTKKSSTSNSKRGQKAIAEPKIDAEYSSDPKSESYENYEEPYLTKHHALNVSFSNYFNTPQETVYRHLPVSEANNMLDMTLYNQGLRLPQAEYFQYPRFNNFREDFSAVSNISNLLSYLPSSMLFKQTSVDNTNYERVPEQVANDEEMYVKDEYVSYSEQETEHQTTAANTTPRSGNWSNKSKTLSNEVIIDDFKLDDFEFDRTLETFGHFQEL